MVPWGLIVTDQLLGTWHLASWTNTHPDGSISHPFGPAPTGYINYSADGFFFVHIARAHRAQTPSTDPFGGTRAEDSAAMKSHLTYAGRFTFNGDHVLHHVTHASFQNWVGGDQRREVTLKGDHLTLSAVGIMLDGASVTATLNWTRANNG